VRQSTSERSSNSCRQWLALFISVVTICTVRFKHSNILYFVLTLYLCVWCRSQNKLRLLPNTELTDCYLQPRHSVFTARYGLCFEGRLMSMLKLPYMAHTFSGGTLHAEAQVRFKFSLFLLYGAESDILQVFIRILLLYSLSIIPPMRSTHPQSCSYKT
jgi:hypothetical protein